MNPSVSVVIPTFNRAGVIERCIKSVQDQTYRDFEIVVVDDASKDNTAEVVEKIQDERIRYIKLEKNTGPSQSRNIGIEKSRGKYIAFLDDDDEWLPEKLEVQVRIFDEADEKIGAVYSAFWRIQKNKRLYIPSKKIKKKEGDLLDNVLKRYMIGTPAILVRKDVLDEVGYFDAELRALVDWDLWIRIARAYHFRFVDKPLTVSYYSKVSVSANRMNVIAAYEVLLKKHADIIMKNRSVLAKIYLRMGNAYSHSGKASEGRSYFFLSLRNNPFKPSAWAGFLASIWGTRFYTMLVNIKKRIRGFGPD
ncbi:glycosyltransferase family 2 protein [Acidobacteriota bacterium]